MKISVFGIGYVGAVSAACLADSGFDVIAVDPDTHKADCINQSRAPFIEKGLENLIAQAVGAGKLSARSDCASAVHETDLSLICVGTPSRQDGSLDLSHVEAVCTEIGHALRDKPDFHIVVLRSTVLPGSVRDFAIPALEKASGKKCGIGFGFAGNPEFLREGSAVADYYNPPKIVIGASDDETASHVLSLYDGIDAPRAVCSIEVAEAVKYADNAWHAMKIGFANEIGAIVHGLGVDSHQVMDIFCLDTKLNISKAYLKPGFAFGGSCLPKDVSAIRAAGQVNGTPTPLFDALLNANKLQVERAAKTIATYNVKNIVLFGLAFKSGTADLRQSPLLKLAGLLLAQSANLKIYDPAVCQSILMHGQSYAGQISPEVLNSIACQPAPDFSDAELFIIGNGDTAYLELLSSADTSVPILDLVRPKNLGAIAARAGYKGLSW